VCWQKILLVGFDIAWEMMGRKGRGNLSFDSRFCYGDLLVCGKEMEGMGVFAF